jgi:hypothetical protein
MAYPATYFLTEGWLKGDRNIWNEYQYCLKKYGPQRTKRVFSAMLAHYQDLALVNTGCESPDIENQMQEIARSLALNYRRIPGTLDYLLQLLQDNWDDARFLVVSPNRTVPGERSAL